MFLIIYINLADTEDGLTAETGLTIKKNLLWQRHILRPISPSHMPNILTYFASY